MLFCGSTGEKRKRQRILSREQSFMSGKSYWQLENTIGHKTLIFLEKVKKSKTITTSTGSLKQRSVVEVTVGLPASSISIDKFLIILSNKSPGTLEKSPGWNQR